MSKFWDHYDAAKSGVADVADDVRHTLIEEAWFGRPTSGNIAEHDMSAGEPARPEAEAVDAELLPTEPIKLNNGGSNYSETWSYDARPIDLYGQSPATLPAPAIEAPTVESDYEPEL